MVLLSDVGLVELCSVRLEIVLILTQDRCTVCAERTIGSSIVLDAPDGLVGDMVRVESRFSRLETVLMSVQDRCTVCTEHTIGIEIVLHIMGPLGDEAQVEAQFGLFGDSPTLHARLVHSLRQTYRRPGHSIGDTGWNS
jgi:hypothetical protein